MYKLFIFILFSFIFCSHTGKCNTGDLVEGIHFKTISPGPDPEPYGDFKTLVIPIKRAGNLIIVEAQIGALSGNFVLDTGAPYLVLNETYFRGMSKIADQESGGINGESTSRSFTTVVNDFSILDLHYSRLTADVTDLSAIENGRGIKILGLLGTRLFSKFAITLDLFRNVMYIQKLDKDDNIPVAEQIYHDRFMQASFKYLNDIIFLKGSVNNNALWFAFDTAAETNLLDYSRCKKMLPAMQVISRSKITGIGGSSFEVIYAKFDELIVGDRTYMFNRVLLTNLEKMGKAYGHSVDGILGYDFFIRGIFTINFPKREFEMYIYTNQ